MPIDRPPDFQRCSKSPHEIMPIDLRASDKHLCRTRLGLCGDTTELKKPPTLLPATERLRLSRREAMRCASSWLHGLIVAAALIATTPAAWSGDIRVGFINPRGPPEFWLLVSATMQAAAAELGIEVDDRYTERSHDKAIALARDFLSQRPPPDYLIATNDLAAGGEIIKLAERAGVPMILLNNDLDEKQWAEYGQPRTQYRRWLGSIVPDHESGGYGIAEAVLHRSGAYQASIVPRSFSRSPGRSTRQPAMTGFAV